MYGRVLCAAELLTRSTIAQRMTDGWGPVPAYRIPTTVGGHFRIGKASEQPPIESEGIPMQCYNAIDQHSNMYEDVALTQEEKPLACPSSLRATYHDEEINTQTELVQLITSRKQDD